MSSNMSHNIKPKQRRQKILFSLIFLVCSAVSFFFFFGSSAKHKRYFRGKNNISRVWTILLIKRIGDITWINKWSLLL